MARTNLSLIQGVLNTSITDASQFIDMANQLVDEIILPKGVLSEGRLTHIETYLAAHFITVYEPVAVSEQAGPVSADYHGKSGRILHASIHGQMAIMLDTTGGLAALQADSSDTKATNKTASVTWVGTDENDDPDLTGSN